jgi:hypothetical protein
VATVHLFTCNFSGSFSSTLGGFTIDVNFTEILGSATTSTMSMRINSTTPEFAKGVCEGSVKLIALSGDTCPTDIGPSSEVQGEIIAGINATCESESKSNFGRAWNLIRNVVFENTAMKL